MSQPPQAYFNACSTGKPEVVAAYLDEGVDPDACDKYGLTGLIWAARKGRVGVAKILLERGADIEKGDIRDRTALCHAVCYLRYDFVDFLVSEGADVSPIDTHGWTPLDIARTERHKKMTAQLERLGAIGRYSGN